MEAKITIRGKKDDAQLIQSALPASVEQYKRETGKDVVCTLDTENFLSPESTGGVEVLALQGRIKVNHLKISTSLQTIFLNHFNFISNRSSTLSSPVSSLLLNNWYPKSVMHCSVAMSTVNSQIKQIKPSFKNSHNP